VIIEGNEEGKSIYGTGPCQKKKEVKTVLYSKEGTIVEAPVKRATALKVSVILLL
jgi:hypothetical protein